jgi:hypothetical protein
MIRGRPKKNVRGHVMDNKTGKFKTGRPTKMNAETIAKLEQAFSIGCTNLEACAFADIDMATLCRYEKRNPSFAERKHRLREKPCLQARNVIVRAINNNDLETAVWYLSRKKKEEFSKRNELTGADGESLYPNQTPDGQEPNHDRSAEIAKATLQCIEERKCTDIDPDSVEDD